MWRSIGPILTGVGAGGVCRHKRQECDDGAPQGRPSYCTRLLKVRPMDASQTVSGALTVLVVDDDALINLNTVDMVQDLGHAAVEAYSGAQALEILASGRRIDVLITDYAMPGMSGLELASQARKLWPNLQVLLATGYNDLPDGAVTDLPRLGKLLRADELSRALPPAGVSQQA